MRPVEAPATLHTDESCSSTGGKELFARLSSFLPTHVLLKIIGGTGEKQRPLKGALPKGAVCPAENPTPRGLSHPVLRCSPLPQLTGPAAG